MGHDAGVWGVCLVSRSGEQRSKRKGKEKEQEKLEEAFGAMDFQTGAPGSTSSKGARRPGTHTTSLKISSDGFITVTGKKGTGKKENKQKGKGVAPGWDSLPTIDFGVGPEVGQQANGGALDHLVPPGLRAALGLRPDFDTSSYGAEGEREAEVDEQIHEQKQEPEGVGVRRRGVVDEDAEEQEEGQYLPFFLSFFPSFSLAAVRHQSTDQRRGYQTIHSTPSSSGVYSGAAERPMLRFRRVGPAERARR